MHDFTFSWATFFSFVSSPKFFFNTTISSLHCFREIDSASTWKTTVRGKRIVFRKDRSPFHWWDAAQTNTGVGPSNLAEIVFEQDQKAPITEKKNQFTLAFSASAFWGSASDWESSSPVSKNNCFTIFRSKQRVRQLGQLFPFWNTTANSPAAASKQRNQTLCQCCRCLNAHLQPLHDAFIVECVATRKSRDVVGEEADQTNDASSLHCRHSHATWRRDNRKSEQTDAVRSKATR